MIICEIRYRTGVGLESGHRSQLLPDIRKLVRKRLGEITGEDVQQICVFLSEIEPRSTCPDLWVEVTLFGISQMAKRAKVQNGLLADLKELLNGQPKCKFSGAVVQVHWSFNKPAAATFGQA